MANALLTSCFDELDKHIAEWPEFYGEPVCNYQWAIYNSQMGILCGKSDYWPHCQLLIVYCLL